MIITLIDTAICNQKVRHGIEVVSNDESNENFSSIQLETEPTDHIKTKTSSVSVQNRTKGR